MWQYLHSTSGEIALAEGALDEADAAFARAFAVAETWRNRVHLANLRINQAYVAQARHDTAGAHMLLSEARELFADAVDPVVRDKLARATAELVEARTRVGSRIC